MEVDVYQDVGGQEERFEDSNKQQPHTAAVATTFQCHAIVLGTTCIPCARQQPLYIKREKNARKN